MAALAVAVMGLVGCGDEPQGTGGNGGTGGAGGNAGAGGTACGNGTTATSSTSTGIGGSGGTGGSGGSGGQPSPFSNADCYWGPENGSPVLRQRLDLVGDMIAVEVCKCEGVFDNGSFEAQLWSYDKPMDMDPVMVANAVVFADATDSCTTTMQVPVDQVPAGTWLQSRLISPSGPAFDGCATEGCVEPDNTYRTAAALYTP